MVKLERSFENGAVLGSLTLLLAATGVLLSPTLGFAQSNLLYAAHVALGLLLIGALLWHVVPLARRILQRLDSAALVVLLAVEVVSGIEIWRHLYVPLPKAIAVITHLVLTFVLLVPLVTHVIKGTRLWWLQRERKPAAVSTGRRVALRLAAYSAAALALAWAFGSAAKSEVEYWRLNSIGRTPALTKESYQLKITGLVNKPITLSWDDLMRMRQIEKKFTHHCVEGWTYTDTFVGIPLPDIMKAAGGVKGGAKMLIFKSPEISTHMLTSGQQYTSSFPVEDGMHDDVLLVHKAHGEDLPAKHGFPLRMMTPRKWGFKACKWLTEIEVSSNENYRGYWERAGYHPDGDYPGPIFG
ncbi:MAG TPA: molybdopterin-dependent oxidoreductase [Candidatus Thermoplasmatota archaeon]|nr:molybdopterin-dependent oxidoreductase [Candidatus Thermoplasmatota archaeon]